MNFFGSASYPDQILTQLLVSRNAEPQEDEDNILFKVKQKRITHSTDGAIRQLTDHINDYPYKLINIPEITSKRSPFEMDDTTAGPVKTPFGYEVGMGKFSINWMVYNFSRQVPFEFANWEDCVDATEKLNQFIAVLERDLQRMERYIPKNKSNEAVEKYREAEEYLQMAKRLSATLTPLARRLKAYHTPITMKDITAVQQHKNMRNLLDGKAKQTPENNLFQNSQDLYMRSRRT